MNEPVCEQSTLFQAGFPVNPTASSVAERQKMMTGTCGRSLYGSSEHCGHGLLLEKMLTASYQQYMSPFAPTWKQKATKSGRFVSRLTLSVPTMRDTGFLLLASPRASQDYKPIRKQTPTEHSGKHGQTLCSSLGIIYPERIGQYINPLYAEWIMGFPLGWGDISNTKSG